MEYLPLSSCSLVSCLSMTLIFTFFYSFLFGGLSLLCCVIIDDPSHGRSFSSKIGSAGASFRLSFFSDARFFSLFFMFALEILFCADPAAPSMGFKIYRPALMYSNNWILACIVEVDVAVSSSNLSIMVSTNLVHGCREEGKLLCFMHLQ